LLRYFFLKYMGVISSQLFTCWGKKHKPLHIYLFLDFWDRALLCNPAWPWTQDPSAFTSWVLARIIDMHHHTQLIFIFDLCLFWLYCHFTF
jgi:hypothetical protein